MPPIYIILDSKQVEQVTNRLGNLTRNAVSAVMEEIGYTAIDILGKSVSNLRKNGSVATSNLANSGRIVKKNKYVTVGYTASYAWIVEHGRKIGTYPPIQPLIDWVHKKRIAFVNKTVTKGKNKGSVKKVKGDDYEKRVKSIAIAISKSIRNHGIRPKPFLIDAFNDAMYDFNTRVINALNRVLR